MNSRILRLCWKQCKAAFNSAFVFKKKIVVLYEIYIFKITMTVSLCIRDIDFCLFFTIFLLNFGISFYYISYLLFIIFGTSYSVKICVYLSQMVFTRYNICIYTNDRSSIMSYIRHAWVDYKHLCQVNYTCSR